LRFENIPNQIFKSGVFIRVQYDILRYQAFMWIFWQLERNITIQLSIPFLQKRDFFPAYSDMNKNMWSLDKFNERRLHTETPQVLSW